MDLAQAMISIKRIEFLLEELLLQQIKTNYPNVEDRKAEHLAAVKNVNENLEEFFESLPDQDKQ